MLNKSPLFYWCAFSRIYTVSLRVQIAIGREYKTSVSYLEYKSQQVWTAGKGALEPRMAIEMSQKNGQDKKKNELRPSSQCRCCSSNSFYQPSLPCKSAWDHLPWWYLLFAETKRYWVIENTFQHLYLRPHLGVGLKCIWKNTHNPLSELQKLGCLPQHNRSIGAVRATACQIL